MYIDPHVVSMLASHFTMLKLALAQSYKLAPHQLVVVGLLGQNGPMLFKDLRVRLSLPKSSFTFLVDGLERRGLVERIREDDDRRQWSIRLTEEGKVFVQDVDRKEAEMLETVIAPLSDKEGSVLLNVAGQLPGRI
ncbi:MAG: MarR family transcriptional regulator [Dehalococcoidia bacterium]|nr:MarR family transcriptional regulator [Dehalococcoidia bacterium]